MCFVIANLSILIARTVRVSVVGGPWIFSVDAVY